MSRDVFDYIRRKMLRDIADAMESFERTLREIEEKLSEIEASERELERVFEENLEEFEKGEMRPAATLVDRGSHYLLVIDTAGVREETLTIDVYRDRVVVRAEMDTEKIARAYGSRAYARIRRIMRGEFRLPQEVDVEKARVEKKAGRVYVKLPKTTSQ